jgi:hypothetical protein
VAVDLFADVAEDFLDDLALDAVVFDLGQVDMGTLFDFPDEAHSAYIMHYMSSIVKSDVHFPLEIQMSSCSVKNQLKFR